ncbi:MAG TPA: hypothetical protein VLM76_07595 [Patescibacteria group bacterium]|nr:hypothetical protein [Patescibacteria group bacterium]
MPPAPHTPAADARDHAALIAALDAGDLAGAERATAESLVVSCAGCAALAGDLVAIRGALPALPVPARRRDYRLTDVDAARLRPSGVRRLLEWLAAPGSTVRPLATGLATLGVVGLLLTAGLPGLGGFGVGDGTLMSAAEAPVQEAAGDRAGAGKGPGADATPAAAPVPADATPAAAPVPPGTPSGDAAAVAGEAAAPDPTVALLADAAERDAAPTGTFLALASLALLAAGLALLAGRSVARRRIP